MNNFSISWVDVLVFLVFVYFIVEAFQVGFWVLLSDFISFLVSLLLALRFYSLVAGLFVDYLGFTHSLANAVGFLIMAAFSEFIFGYLIFSFFKKMPFKLWKIKIPKIFGLIPALGEGLVLVSFILMLALGLPLPSSVKTDLTASKAGGFLVGKTSNIERQVNKVFGGLLEDTLTYFTIRSGSSEIHQINADYVEVIFDENSEAKMTVLINSERQSRGIGWLVKDDALTQVARNYAQLMWQEKFFGHYTPQGQDVVDRLDGQDINFSLVGENLALAPTVETAHIGLMNSEGHRDNILDGDFHKVGVGVADNGVYGKIFVQIFTD